LSEDSGLAVCRGWRGSGKDALAVLPVSAQPRSATLDRLTREYALKDELDGAWAVRPLELVQDRGRTILVLEDPGGEPLSRFLGKPIDMGHFLPLATGVAAALGKVHQRGLIHKDIKPANILVNGAEGGEVRLMGFGIASRLRRERQSPEPPESIAGTLAYMAPEQTGRMNRSIDSRSDLYALGVTFYEMLTGSLPFTASDPMEWVHCHIARQADAPGARANGIPEVLSAIAMKLLAKTAEERYQTAAGVEADLRRCVSEWQSHGRIDPFPLGAEDSSDRLAIPEKLYGREREVDTLLAAFDRVVAQGTVELALVSGYSGVGKSSVVNELHKVLVPPRGLFAAGKFDQYMRDVPYATLAQAFQTLARQILVTSEAEVDRWRQALLEALGPNGQLMVDLIPEVEFIIGKQPPVAELPPQEARNRLQLVFRRFLGVFARQEHPLALFLDDLQWLDTATLELLESLITHPDVRHVLVIGAYRDNEVGPSHPLMRTLAAIREAGAAVRDIRLTPLGSDDLAHLVSDALHCEPQRSASLAQLIHAKTAGNPFFAIQFIHALVEEGLIAFEPADARWRWDLDAIRVKGHTDNVVDLMVAKLSRLPVTSQNALQRFACLGNSADVAALSVVLEGAEQETETKLWEASYQELIVRSGDSYRFMHDRIQEAAYLLIAEEARAEVHLRIGRLLYSHTPPEKREEAIFEIVNQLNRGADLITSEDERIQLAELNLVAGKRAKASTAYASALKYFVAGEALLKNEPWERRYDLIFRLELQRAECEFLTGDADTADRRLAALSLRARGDVDRSEAVCLQIEVCTATSRSNRAVELCLEYLRSVGIEWTSHPTKEQFDKEYDQFVQKLAGRPIEALIDLPRLDDPIQRATLNVLSAVGPAAFFTDGNLLNLTLCRMSNISVMYGNDERSPLAYIYLGSILGPQFGDYATGYRLGKLGIDLVEQGLDRWKCRVYVVFGSLVNPWSRHVRTSHGWIRQAFEAAVNVGDFTYAGYCCQNLIPLLIANGNDLAEVHGEALKRLEFARKIKFDLVVDCLTGQLALIRQLCGLTLDFSSFDDGEFDEKAFEQHLDGDPLLAFPACWYWIRKLQARFYALDYPAALAAAAKAESLLWTSAQFFETAEYHFFSALSHASICPRDELEERQRCLEAIAAHQKQLAIWAKNCPENFDNRAALVGAEIARIEGRILDAEQLYEDAIHSAQMNGLVHNEALANELAARFYRARGFEKVANAYLKDARSLYAQWGSHGKVRQLDELYPRLREKQTSAPSMPVGPSVGQLDVETVVKASQAISSEMILPSLIEKLLRIAVENAGAERGMLILLRNGEPRIEARAATGSGRIEVAAGQAAVTPSDLPQSALNYVIRTQERVLLDDASAETLYSKDEYVRLNRPRSVLCLPIVKQGTLIGALYLENKLAAFVFTPDRVTLLQLLASQAAISLENAALYTDLQLQVGLLQRLPVSAWTLEPDGTPDFVNQVWLEFSGQDLDFVRSHPAAWMTAVHPEDREMAAKSFWKGVHSGQDFAFETRSLRAQDGAYRWHLQQAVVLRDAEGKVLKFVGTTTDIDDQKRTEEALREALGDLARINRVTTMGELTASLAHEISQPISGAITNANVCLRWLGHERPDLDEVRAAIARFLRDAQRAAAVIKRIRAQFERGSVDHETLDVSEIIRETVALLRGEAARHNISVRTELAADLPHIVGDRLQLQQVAMNLIVNSIEAMKEVDGIREMAIKSQRAENGQILVSVSDTGTGFPPQLAEQIFDPFFTTKPHGTGMGLRISRSIIESHGGRLWAVGSSGRGADFHLALPAAIPGHG
jgi:PAS domain S-box-containing protein